jgi:hypothetical protein
VGIGKYQYFHVHHPYFQAISNHSIFSAGFPPLMCPQCNFPYPVTFAFCRAYSDTEAKLSRRGGNSMQNNNDVMAKALRMAQSEAGQQLLSMLKHSGGQELDQAMNQAAAGDYTAAKLLLNNLMKDPQAQELMKRLGGSHGSDGR